MELAANEWVLTLPVTQLAALGELRLRPGLEIALVGGTLWLRGGALDQTLYEALRQLPGFTGWRVHDGRRLCRWDRKVPEAVLPQLPWKALSEMLQVAIHPGVAVGLLTERATLRLTRSAEERPASVLLTSWEDWTHWAITAPEVRLARLRFAVETRGRAVVWGSPLPPLPGFFFAEEKGIGIPCGWACEPAMPAPALRAWLGLAQGDLALLDPCGSHRILRADQLLLANRPNVRATASMT
jgi:hypothetical protein